MSAKAAQATGEKGLRAWINSPTGTKTTHFWGPVANWGFVIAVSGDVVRGELRDPPPQRSLGPRQRVDLASREAREKWPVCPNPWDLAPIVAIDRYFEAKSSDSLL